MEVDRVLESIVWSSSGFGPESDEKGNMQIPERKQMK